MGKQKKWFGVLMAGMLLIGGMLSGCGFFDGKMKENIVYMNYNDQSKFAEIIKEEFVKIANENELVVDYLDAQGNADLQRQQLDQVTKDGAKAVILLAVDGDSMVSAAENAVAAGIPVIAVNRKVNSAKVLNVIPNDYEAGVLQARYMEQNLPPGARVLYLQGPETQDGAQLRWVGFKEVYLDKHPDVKLLDRKCANYDRGEAKRIMMEWLSEHARVDAVVCGNDQMALGVVDALKEAKRQTGCHVSGIDAVHEALEAVREGDMDQTVYQNALYQASGAYRLMDEIYHGMHPKHGISVPFVSITRENISEYDK